MLSEVFGNLSQVFWISAQLPQMWKNYRNKSVQGLSLPFLLNWLCGDITNLIGCLLTNQLSFQRNLAIYFNLIDLVLIGQFILYSKPSSSSGSPPSSGLEDPSNIDSSTNPVEGFLDEPPTTGRIRHSHLHRERTSATFDNKLGLNLSPYRSTSLNTRSISDETSKTWCPLLHPRIHPSVPSHPHHNISNENSSHPTTTTTSTRSSVGSLSIKILFFLAICGFLIFEATTTKHLFSSIHASHPTDLPQTLQPFNQHNSTRLESKTTQPIRLLRIKRGTSHLTTESNPRNKTKEKGKEITQRIGRISAWLCAILYLTSRIPQIYKNYCRKSVEGLSILLFILAFLGNLTYVSSILTSPKILGGGGAGSDEEDKLGYLKESIPYLIGSGGTLCFDFTIFAQSWLYKDSPPSSKAYTRLSTTPDSESSSPCSNSITNL